MTKYCTHYHIINSVAGPLSKHHISAAGPVGYQHFTPVLDTELLLYGKPITPLPAQVSPNLDTGSVSPMMPVRAILKQLARERRHLVDVTVHNLGSGPLPARRCGSAFQEDLDYDSFVASMHTIPLPRQEAQPPFWSPDAQSLRRISHAAFQLAFQFYTESTPRDWNILAECVPGGTTTAGLWLAVANGGPIETPSSSHEIGPQLRKQALIDQWASAALKYLPINSTEALWRFALANGDYYQIFMLAFLFEYADLMKYDRGGTPRNPILLAGGSQVAAPLALFKMANPRLATILAPHVKLVTTPWVMQAAPQVVFNELIYPFVSDAHFDFAFTKEDGPYYLYEQGYTKEGCGLGALLWYAAVHGVSTADIRYWCRDILERYNRQPEPEVEVAYPRPPLTSATSLT